MLKLSEILTAIYESGLDENDLSLVVERARMALEVSIHDGLYSEKQLDFLTRLQDIADEVRLFYSYK